MAKKTTMLTEAARAFMAAIEIEQKHREELKKLMLQEGVKAIQIQDKIIQLSYGSLSIENGKILTVDND